MSEEVLTDFQDRLLVIARWNARGLHLMAETGLRMLMQDMQAALEQASQRKVC